jgi:predicted GNAT family acetyltransferase
MDQDVAPFEVKNNREAGRFEVQLGDETGFIAYHLQSPNEYVLVHTEVPVSQRGKGVAGRLAQDVLEMIKTEGSKLVLICPFVTAYIKRHPEYQPLVVPLRV